VAYGREAAPEINLRVLQSEKGLLRSRTSQGAAGGKIVPIGFQMHVAIDQTGKHCCRAEVDESSAIRSALRDRVDAIAADDNECIRHIPGSNIEQAPRVHCGDLGLSGSRKQ